MRFGEKKINCHMNPLLPKLFVQVLHGLCKDLSGHLHLIEYQKPYSKPVFLLKHQGVAADPMNRRQIFLMPVALITTRTEI